MRDISFKGPNYFSYGTFFEIIIREVNKSRVLTIQGDYFEWCLPFGFVYDEDIKSISVSFLCFKLIYEWEN